MGPVPQPSQSPPRSRGRGGGAVGDFPVEGRGAARAVGLERRGEGAPGRGAVGRAAVPGAPGGRVQCGPGRVRPPQAPEERSQVPRRALQGQLQQVPRARQERRRPPQPQQHRNPRRLPRQLLAPHPSIPFPSQSLTLLGTHLPASPIQPHHNFMPSNSVPKHPVHVQSPSCACSERILCMFRAHPVHFESSSTDSSPVRYEPSNLHKHHRHPGTDDLSGSYGWVPWLLVVHPGVGQGLRSITTDLLSIEDIFESCLQ